MKHYPDIVVRLTSVGRESEVVACLATLSALRVAGVDREKRQEFIRETFARPQERMEVIEEWVTVALDTAEEWRT